MTEYNKQQQKSTTKLDHNKGEDTGSNNSMFNKISI